MSPRRAAGHSTKYARSNYPVLFLGVGFEDAYLTELRSETLALLGYERGQMPVGWAVSHDCEPATRAFFKDHEGIELLGYDAGGDGCDHSGFDRYLEALYDATHPLPYLSRLLADRRLLWLGPRQEDDAPGLRLLRRAAGQLGDRPDRFVQVETVEQAIAALHGPPATPCPFQLVIAAWGTSATQPTAIALLETMRQQDLRLPRDRALHVALRRRCTQASGARARRPGVLLPLGVAASGGAEDPRRG